jgi:hypothetical protein
VNALSGGCLCGAVRYRAGPALHAATLCHCESCRRAQGAHAIAWVTVASPSLEWSGEPARYRSSPGVIRSFCARCGTPLSYSSEGRGAETDLTVCSLDEAGALAPCDHIFMADALSWDRPGDGLAQHAKTRSG